MKSYLDEALEKVGLFGCEYGVRVTLFGFKGARVEGHDGLVDYTDTEVAVRAGREKIPIRGEKLIVKELSRDEIFVAGKISGAEKTK